jgi:hypothetical protein
MHARLRLFGFQKSLYETSFVKSEAFIVVSITVTVFWDAKLCIMMQVDAEGAYFSEKPVPFYRTA